MGELIYTIEVLKCGDPDRWYFNQVGQTFRAYMNTYTFSIQEDVDSKKTEIRKIHASDCKIVEPEKKEQIIRNKLQIFLLKPFSEVRVVKRNTTIPKVAGKNTNHMRVANLVDHVKTPLLSYKSKSIEHAREQLARENQKNIRSAYYYDNAGQKHVLFELTTDQVISETK